MSPVALGLDLLLIALLLVAVVIGLKLNKKLKTLRDSQLGFVKAVQELDGAAARAEAGLNALRAVQDQTHDSLLARIETARGLITRLEQAGARVAAPAPTPQLAAAAPPVRASAPARPADPSPVRAPAPVQPARPAAASAQRATAPLRAAAPAPREAVPLRPQAPAFTREALRGPRPSTREIDDDLFEESERPPLRRDFRR